MKHLHEKSSCCKGRIINYGHRRRQCVLCKKTWRRWKKKTGRKRKRVSQSLFLKYISNEISSLYALSKKEKRKSQDTLQREVRGGLKKFITATPWPQIPKGPLVAIADAMIINIDKKIYTFYFVLLRPVNGNTAIITPPCIQEGSECKDGWRDALQALTVLPSILALISDGNLGLVALGREYGWQVQKCHFHILAKIQGRRSRWIRSRHRDMGELLYLLVKNALTNPNEDRAAESILELGVLSQDIGSVQLRKYLRGFIKHYQDYRTYLHHPKLNLPTTSNSAESLISGLRNLYYKAHGFRTIESLKLWTHAFLKYKKTIACNGSLPTKFMR